jgi:hypothetical protein
MFGVSESQLERGRRFMTSQQKASAIKCLIVQFSRKAWVPILFLAGLLCLFSASSSAAFSPSEHRASQRLTAAQQVQPARVSAVIRRETRTLVTLHTAGGAIVTTPEHPFARVGSGWIPAGELAVGDRIVTASEDDPATILQLEIQRVRPTSVYNFTVEHGHAYHVGPDRLLVHNMDQGQCSQNRPTERAKDRRKREKAEKEAKERQELEDREEKKRATEATVEANREKLERRQAEAVAALQTLKNAIRELDPEAQIGFRGSLANGRKGAQKGNAPWNPDDYDVDAFIVSDVLASRWETPDDRGVSVSSTGNKMRNGKKVGNGWRDLDDRLGPEDQKLREGLDEAERTIKMMDGVRPEEKFKIRIFSTEEFRKMQNRSQDPLFPDKPVMARRAAVRRSPAVLVGSPASALFITV